MAGSVRGIAEGKKTVDEIGWHPMDLPFSAAAPLLPLLQREKGCGQLV